MVMIVSLNEWWEALSAPHQVFWFIAVVFSVLFFIQFVLMLIGFDADGDSDLHADGIDGGHEFSALSVRSIIAFFTFFGWTGVLALNNGLAVWLAVTLAAGVGLGAMFIVAYLMFKFAQLEQSGTLNLYNAIDREGEVYLPIPAACEGRGKVHLLVDGRLRELDAITAGPRLRTGDAIKVVEILDDNVLKVEPIERQSHIANTNL
jgi:membrane protein implicated in regulation of membrane protease activity